ncbi:MAG TPA: prolyl-tRNA synthetase associated domain-containing protein [Geminicoccaceae bacterium]|nr:prolyl-tRNA synthetase associated domain-containing protein [Geminicoccaceae bacterium]
MALEPDQLLQRLTELGIGHRTLEHPAVFTVEEARRHTAHLPGGHCKSLFLKDKKGGLWLLVCLDHRRIDMGRLAKAIASPRLSFGKAELLQEILGVGPGSVTPFALVNDRDRRVQPLLDQAMLARDRLNFHPLTNRATDDRRRRSAAVPRGLRSPAAGHRSRRERGRRGAAGRDLRLIPLDRAHSSSISSRMQHGRRTWPASFRSSKSSRCAGTWSTSRSAS